MEQSKFTYFPLEKALEKKKNSETSCCFKVPEPFQ